MLIPRPLFCPVCRARLQAEAAGFRCPGCKQSYPLIGSIPSLVNRSSYKQEFDDTIFKFLFEMEQKHFWHIGRREIILDILKNNKADLENKQMLEAGCGNGSVLSFLLKNGITSEGSDIEIKGLDLCRRREPNAVLYQADICSLPFQDEFDIVGAFDVLEHIHDDVSALRSINRTLKPGGRLLLTVPAFQSLWSSFDEAAYHKRRYNKEEICGRLEETGYSILRATYYMFFLFPAVAAIRRIRGVDTKQSRFDFSNSTEFKTIPGINELFLLALRLEKLLMRRVNLPFGTSLLVLARKNDVK